MNHDKTMSIDELNARIKTIPDEKWEKVFIEHIEKHTPNKDGSCKQDGCTGFVVKSVCGLSSIGYHYSLPTCNVCGHQYIFTPDTMHILIVGMKEFEEMMNTPFTI